MIIRLLSLALLIATLPSCVAIRSITTVGFHDHRTILEYDIPTFDTVSSGKVSKPSVSVTLRNYTDFDSVELMNAIQDSSLQPYLETPRQGADIIIEAVLTNYYKVRGIEWENLMTIGHEAFPEYKSSFSSYEDRHASYNYHIQPGKEAGSKNNVKINSGLILGPVTASVPSFVSHNRIDLMGATAGGIIGLMADSSLKSVLIGGAIGSVVFTGFDLLMYPTSWLGVVNLNVYYKVGNVDTSIFSAAEDVSRNKSFTNKTSYYLKKNSDYITFSTRALIGTRGIWMSQEKSSVLTNQLIVNLMKGFLPTLLLVDDSN